MFCLKCGKQIPDQSVFCLYCGTQLPPLNAQQQSEWDIRPRPAPQDAPSDSVVLPPEHAPVKTVPGTAFAVAEKENLPLTTPDATIGLPAPELRRCSACGRELPETSISEVCVTCLNNRSFVATELPDELFDTLFTEDQSPGVSAAQNADAAPVSAAYADLQPVPKSDFRLDIDLDSEYPTAYAEPAPKPKREIKNPKKLAILIFIMSAVLLAGGVALALPYLLPSVFDGSSTSASAQSNVERKAVSYAHEMLKEACVNPDSVVFHKDVTAEETDGVWSVTETFDRTSKQGEFATTTYTALLRMDSKKDTGFVPLKLRIDDTIMYDHTTG